MASNFRRIAEQNIFPGESGGDYNALFGYSNREGGRYGGQKLTDMTLNQALDFSKPSGDYGQWVKGQVGRVATPMGAYQVVGTTLRDAQKGLGLTGEERMTEGLQDRIGEWIYQNQGSGAWEGWRGAPSGGGQSIANDAMTALGQQPISAASTPTGGILSNEGNQMAQQPQGLLGSMGIQRRDPNAQGETSQPFYNRKSFGDTMARIAPALGRMGVMGLEGPAQAALDDRNKRQGDERVKQAQAARTNQTIEWMRSQPNGEKFAAMAEAVGVGPAIKAQQAANKPMSQMDQIGLETAQVELDRLRNPAPDREGEAKLRREFVSLPIVKSFSDQSTAYGRVLASVNDPTPSGDLALIFNFMKVLDPGSTVREGEFATAAQSGGVDDRVRALYNQVVEGTRLSAVQRDDFADRATRLYANAEQQYTGVADQYAAFATQSGYDPATMMPDFRYSGDRYQTPISLTPPQLTGQQLGQLGIALAEWPGVWADMTDQERKEFAGAN
jgi:hypothetical protein